MEYSADSGWSRIIGEMLPLSDCDICSPPLDIGPPPPLPANFQGTADFSGGCNVCNNLGDVEIRPAQISDASLLPIVATLIVGVLLIVVTLIVLFVKVKKCRAFLPYMLCWMFPRSMLPHTELAPSSLPSPSPSTEKLKGGKRKWHGSSHSLQSENIYEVCSPPSQDSLYEEVGPPQKSHCSPYGVVLVDKSCGKASTGVGGSSNMLRPWLAPGPSYPGSEALATCGDETGSFSAFSTFGGSGRGFFNPVVRDGANSATLQPRQTHHSYKSLKNALDVQNANDGGSKAENAQFLPPLQKRQLPPVPVETITFSM